MEPYVNFEFDGDMKVEPTIFTSFWRREILLEDTCQFSEYTPWIFVYYDRVSVSSRAHCSLPVASALASIWPKTHPKALRASGIREISKLPNG